MAKNNMAIDPNTINIICAGTQITGDITTEGEIRVDGVLNGTLTAKGKVVIGETGSLKGELACRNADIQGKVEGKITIQELLAFRRTAVFTGELTTAQLAIEPGAIFNGSCKMNAGSRAESAEKK